jgi:hypothetical protein
MWPFAKTTLDDPPEINSATPAESLADRAEVARRRVTEVHDALTQIDHEFRIFKTRHSVTASKFGILLRCQSSFAERPVIERQWKEMLKRRDAAVASWHTALREWSALKEQASKEHAA